MLWSLGAALDASTSLHAHAIYEFVICLGEGGRLTTEAAAFPLRAGRTALVPPGVPHRYDLASGERATLRVICINPRDLPTFASAATAAALAVASAAGVTIADHAGQSGVLGDLADLVGDKLGAVDSAEELTDWGVVGLLLAMHLRRRGSRTGAAARYCERIDEVIAWVEANLGEPITLDQAAGRFGMSRSLLTREFRRHTGNSFVDHCNGRRLHAAAQRLATCTDAVSDIAIGCGFSNLSHFYHLFKRRFGLTPAGFRHRIADGGL